MGTKGHTPVVSVPVAIEPTQQAHELEPVPIWARYPALTVTIVATIVALLVTEPLIFRLSSAIYSDNPGDAKGAIYDFWWWSYAVRHGLGLFSNPPLGAPLDAGWQQVPYTVLMVAIFAPLSVLSSPTVAYNLGILASFPATALVTYLLARRLGLTPLASAFASLAFTFAPYHVEKAMGHLTQAHLEVFPGTLLFLIRWRQKGSKRNLIGAGVISGLTVWTDSYYAFILAFLVLAFFAMSLLVPASGTSTIVDRIVKHLMGLGVVGVVVAVFLPLAILVAYRPSPANYGQSVITGVSGLERSLREVQVWSLRPREFVLPWHSNPLTPKRIRGFEQEHLHGSNPTENSLFLGYTVMLLALVGVVAARRAFPIVLGMAICLEGLILGLPPHFQVLGLNLRGPSLVLHRAVPFFRVYSRFGLLVLFGASLLAGLGFAWLQGHARSVKLRWAMVVPFLLLALEFNNQPPSHVLTLFPAPEAYQWLAGQPAGILVEYPLGVGRPEIIEVQAEDYMLYQQVHEHPLFNNVVVTSAAHRLAPSLEPYYKPGVADQLRALGIRYLFVHRDSYRKAGYVTLQMVDGLRFTGSFGDVDVFTID